MKKIFYGFVCYKMVLAEIPAKRGISNALIKLAFMKGSYFYHI